jgi:hypothetical protein
MLRVHFSNCQDVSNGIIGDNFGCCSASRATLGTKLDLCSEVGSAEKEPGAAGSRLEEAFALRSNPWRVRDWPCSPRTEAKSLRRWIVRAFGTNVLLTQYDSRRYFPFDNSAEALAEPWGGVCTV